MNEKGHCRSFRNHVISSPSTDKFFKQRCIKYVNFTEIEIHCLYIHKSHWSENSAESRDNFIIFLQRMMEMCLTENVIIIDTTKVIIYTCRYIKATGLTRWPYRDFCGVGYAQRWGSTAHDYANQKAWLVNPCTVWRVQASLLPQGTFRLNWK